MVLSNVIVYSTISGCLFVFSQSYMYILISAGLTNISGPAVAAFDLVNCSLSAVCLLLVKSLWDFRQQA